MAETMVAPMAKKKPSEDMTSVKLGKPLARRLNVIAAHEDESLQGLVARVLTEFADKAYPTTGQSIIKESKDKD